MNKKDCEEEETTYIKVKTLYSLGLKSEDNCHLGTSFCGTKLEA